MWHHVIRYTVTNISEEPVASSFVFYFSTQKMVAAHSSKMWVNSYLTKQNNMQKTTIFNTTVTQQLFMLDHTHTYQMSLKISKKFHAWNMWQHIILSIIIFHRVLKHMNKIRTTHILDEFKDQNYWIWLK